MFKAINKCINKIFDTDQKLTRKETTVITLAYALFLIGAIIALIILCSPIAE
ncbi:hypothetical protein [Lactobacillus iners]|uniref:hypothetical protein n=1 Tax=Lactobacillus iners TaxID=147802 RepID=UPI003EBA465F